MFDSLAEQIKRDEREQVHGPERALRMLAIVVVSVLVFSGLYVAVQLSSQLAGN